MKLRPEVEQTQISNADKKASIPFRIPDISLMMKTFRNDFYSQKIRTPVQEYLSNGRDAHRVAGKSSVPLKVTLPTTINPVFKVRDFGSGLTRDELINIFSSYFISTKRDSNDVTGNFGLGGKSCWAYGPTFTILSYVDGICMTYIADISTRAEGELNHLGDFITEETNGVEISIPLLSISDIAEFTSAVYRSTFFWDVKPIICGAVEEEIPLFWREGVSKHIFADKNWSLYSRAEISPFIESAKIVFSIDGIPYPVPFNTMINSNFAPLTSYLSQDVTLVISLPNGVCDVNPNREMINESKQSVEAMNESVNGILASLQSKVNSLWKDDATLVECLTNLQKRDFILSTQPRANRKKCDGLNIILNPVEKNQYNLSVEADFFSNFKTNVFYYGSRGNKTNVRLDLPQDPSKMSLNMFYNDLNQVPTLGKTRTRINNFLEHDKSARISIFSRHKETVESNFQTLIKALELKPLSSLPLPPKAVTQGLLHLSRV